MKRRDLFKGIFGTLIALAVKPLMGLVPAKQQKISFKGKMISMGWPRQHGQWIVEVERDGAWHQCTGIDILSTDMQTVRGTFYSCAVCGCSDIVEISHGTMKCWGDCRVCGAHSRITRYEEFIPAEFPRKLHGKLEGWEVDSDGLMSMRGQDRFETLNRNGEITNRDIQYRLISEERGEVQAIETPSRPFAVGDTVRLSSWVGELKGLSRG
jgi:hypothetical protein